MSRKVDAFRQQIANPMNIHNFLVDIPELGEYAMTIQSTSYPSEQTRVTTLAVAGELVSYPTVPENSHSWSFMIPENDDGRAYNLCEGLRRKYWDQMSGAITTGVDTPYQDIVISARDLNGNIKFRVKLHNAWCLGRQDVNLDQNDPTQNWKWNYQFRFDYIEDLLPR